MRLHTYRDESRSRHFDLTGGGTPGPLTWLPQQLLASYWWASPVLS